MLITIIPKAMQARIRETPRNKERPAVTKIAVSVTTRISSFSTSLLRRKEKTPPIMNPMTSAPPISINGVTTTFDTENTPYDNNTPTSAIENA
jgi:hypothetical protein